MRWETVWTHSSRAWALVVLRRPYRMACSAFLEFGLPNTPMKVGHSRSTAACNCSRPSSVAARLRHTRAPCAMWTRSSRMMVRTASAHGL